MSAPRCETHFCVRSTFALLLFLVSAALYGPAQVPPTTNPPEYGPYNAMLLPDGPGLRYPMTPLRATPSPTESRHADEPAYQDSILQPASTWTLSAWYCPSEKITGRALIAGVGNITGDYPRYIALEQGRVALWMGKGNEISAPITAMNSNTWHLLSAVFDGSEAR